MNKKLMGGFLAVTAFIAFSAASQVSAEPLKGAISIDGSSTVFPITEAVAEEFQKTNKDVRVTVGISGTGGGFKKFGAGEIDICDASRKIKSEEVANLKKNGIEYLEIAVAYDGITLVVNPKNSFVDKLTLEELKKIWKPESDVKTWKQVRAGFPDAPIKLFGPGTDSGTFDYFTEEVNGKAKMSRSDYTKSEDDNVLVTGVSGDQNSLGYFGFAYYKENQKKLRAVPIDNGKGAVTPSIDTIRNGKYAPLSREVYIYVTRKALKKPEVRAFVEYYLSNAEALVSQVGFIPLKTAEYKKGQTSVAAFAK